MAEAIKVIQLLWSEERVDFEGDYYKLRRATIYDRPDEPVPIYVAASGPLAAKLAGRVGDGFICTSGKDPQLYVDLLDNVREGAEKAGRDYESIKRMIEVKVSYDRDPEVAEKATHWWAALALTPEEKEGVEDPVEMERLADNARRPRAHALHRLRRPAGDRRQDPAVRRPRLHGAGLPLPRQRPAALHRRVRRRRLPAAADMSASRSSTSASSRCVKTDGAARPPLRGLPLGRGPGVLPRPPRAGVVRHPERPHAALRRGDGRRRRVPLARGLHQRPHGRPPGPAGQLRARQPARHAHRARRLDHRARRPLRRQAAQQPQRRRRPLRRRGLLHRPGLRDRERLRGPQGPRWSRRAATSSGSTRSPAR